MLHSLEITHSNLYAPELDSWKSLQLNLACELWRDS